MRKDRRQKTEYEQRDLNPHRDTEIEKAAAETRTRLESRGVTLNGRESPDELADLLSAVEEFERTVQAHGGDLMVDDLKSSQPDDPHFVLPRRGSGESVAGYIGRIDQATAELHRHPAHPD